MDNIELVLNDKHKLNRFSEYSFSKDLYSIANEFSFTLKRPEFEVLTGSKCQLKINNILQFTGIVTNISVSWDNSGIKYNISGKSLGFLIASQYCEKFNNYSGIAFKTIIITILEKIPIIKNLITENKLIIDKSISKLIAVAEDDEWKPSIGDTCFDFIKTLCNYHGLIFYIDSNNNLIFDKPKQTGQNKFFFTLYNKDISSFESKSNILSASYEKNINNYYGTHIIYGQTDADSDFNIKKIYSDSTAPINLTKVTQQQQNKNYDRLGRQLIEEQQSDSESIQYVVSGHSQNGQIYDINELSHVYDDCFNVRGSYLVNSLVFSGSNTGVSTQITLSKKGISA